MDVVDHEDHQRQAAQEVDREIALRRRDRSWAIRESRQRRRARTLRRMCAQCMAGAAATVAGATGIRAWLGTRRPTWLGERGFRACVTGLAVAAVLGAGLLGPGG